MKISEMVVKNIGLDNKQEYTLLNLLIKKIDPDAILLRFWNLKGGISAQTIGIEVLTSDKIRKKFIIRKFVSKNKIKYIKKLKNEFALLKFLRSTSTNIPTPIPYYFETPNQIFSQPYLVLEYIEGETEFNPTNVHDFITKFTLILSNIHKINIENYNFSFLPDQNKENSQKLEELALDPNISKSLIEILSNNKPIHLNDPVLLHGDYWPGNILWHTNEIVGVIDWEDAALGDPLIDIANSRLEILWAFGIDAMNEFTKQYQLSMPSINFNNQPYWDLFIGTRIALEFGNWSDNIITKRQMNEKHQFFIKQALQSFK